VEDERASRIRSLKEGGVFPIINVLER